MVDQALRCAIEEKVMKEAMKKKNDKFLKELKRSLRNQEDLLSEEFTPEEFYAMDAEFHAICFGFTGKEFVWEEIEKMLVHYKRFRMLDIVVVQDFQTIYEEHVEFVQIMEQGAEDLVGNKIAKHLYGGINRLGDKIHGEYKEYFRENES